MLERIFRTTSSDIVELARFSNLAFNKVHVGLHVTLWKDKDAVKDRYWCFLSIIVHVYMSCNRFFD